MEKKFECYACGAKTTHDVNKRHLPFKWHSRKIEGRALTLCDGCSMGLKAGVNYRLDNDAVSPDLRELLEDKL